MTAPSSAPQYPVKSVAIRKSTAMQDICLNAVGRSIPDGNAILVSSMLIRWSHVNSDFRPTRCRR
jgi:hypothetical protein